MGFFDGFKSGITSGLNLSSVNLPSFISGVLDRNQGITTDPYAGGVGQTAELSRSKNILERLMRIRFAQGWQWTVEVDGMQDFEFYIKDITYGGNSIESEVRIIGGGEINKPTHRTTESVTMVVRDNETGTVAKWFDARKNKVINADGTINLPPSYLLNIRIYRLNSDGQKELDRECKVIPLERGETTRSRDNVGEFFTYPLSFRSYSSFGSSVIPSISSIPDAGTKNNSGVTGTSGINGDY